MAEGKKTYYQVSFTGGQALAAVVVLMLALGASFFLGAKAGFEKSEPEAAAPRPAAVPAPSPSPTSSSPATTETPVSTASETAPSTEEAPVFEDREAGVAEAPKSSTAAPSPASGAPSRTELASPPKASGSPPPAKASAPSERAPEAPKASAETARKGSAGTGFWVQIVSTSSHAEANRWKEKLAAKKYRTAAVSSVESPKGKLWRVRIGPYADRAQANKAAEKVTAEFRQKAWVAPE